MINEKKNIYLKCKDTTPYEFYWLNESLFQDILSKLSDRENNNNNNNNNKDNMLDKNYNNNNLSNRILSNDEFEKKICTIGYIIETNYDESEALLKYDNSVIKIDISRIKDSYKISKDPFFCYGILKKKNNVPLFVINIFRMLNTDFSFESYKSSINYQRKIVYECLNSN